MKRSATIHGAGATPADAIAAAMEYRDQIYPGWEVVTDMEITRLVNAGGRWFYAWATAAGEVDA